MKCKYTSIRRPVKYMWSQEFGSRDEAMEAERQIKKWTRAKKEALIKGDFIMLSNKAKKKNWEEYRKREEKRTDEF